MPIAEGTSNATRSGNIREVLHSFKKTGRIGNSKPGSMKEAVAQAAAIAYRKQRESRRTIAHG